MTTHNTVKSDHIFEKHKTVYTYRVLMSQPTNQPKGSFGESLLKVMILVAGVIALIGVPIGLYMVFQLIAMHMAFGDLSNSVSQSALSQIAYNVTHVGQYQSLAQMELGYGISMSNADNNIALFGLLIGFVIDVPIAILIHREYKELD
jgi:hypothetical protein